jgi:hypothetical protein
MLPVADVEDILDTKGYLQAPLDFWPLRLWSQVMVSTEEDEQYGEMKAALDFAIVV